MAKKRNRIMWQLVPFFILAAGLFLPSCGFIGLLFDGDEDGEGGTRYYTLQMSYNYSGTHTVSTTSPLVFLFIPLDENNQFTDDGFDSATYIPTFVDNGMVIVEDLREGSYAVLGYIDGNGDGKLNMGEVYAFYNMRDFVSSFENPDCIVVDSMIEELTPHFDLTDDYIMKGLFLLVPKTGETLEGVNVGGTIHLIQILGISIEKHINLLDIYVSPPFTLLHDDVSVGGQDTWFLSVDMFGFPSGSYTLTIDGYSDTLFVDSDWVGFNYVEP